MAWEWRRPTAVGGGPDRRANETGTKDDPEAEYPAVDEAVQTTKGRACQPTGPDGTRRSAPAGSDEGLTPVEAI